MPLRDDLLNPIPGQNPTGENVRYTVYDKIKEARREDDDAPQGLWQRERKTADWALALKLAGDALATKSKDLQLAAWLTEALLRKEGVAGLKQGIELTSGLIETFWDTLYPELEDGDAELRAAPLQWVGDRLDIACKRSPLTRSGLDWFQYKESRTIGYEQDSADDQDKLNARQAAIAEGKITADDFDKDFDVTPKVFYQNLVQTFEGTLASIAALGELCESRFENSCPSFGRLRETLEELQQTAKILLQKKREKEPDPVTEEAASYASLGYDAPVDSDTPQPSGSEHRATAVVSQLTVRDDAVRMVIDASAFLRREDPYSPVPYLMLRGLRWGELRANGATIDPFLLEAPPTEIRQRLKRQSIEGNWTEALETAETAMAMPCGRGWLDLQRQVSRACAELGSYYDPIALAVRSELRALLTDLPQLPELTMMDDTPTANAETQAWIKQTLGPPPEPAAEAPYGMQEPTAQPETTTGSPDPFALALEAARSGNEQDGIEILTREITNERSGRGRFHRKVQLSQLCLSMGREDIAYPILSALAGEIEQRKLDEWEASDTVAHPLALLFRCISKMDRAAAEKQKLYEWICRLDPLQALACSR